MRDEAGVGWECGVGHAELGSSGFGEDNIVWFEKTTETLPGVGLGYWARFRVIQNWWLDTISKFKAKSGDN